MFKKINKLLMSLENRDHPSLGLLLRCHTFSGLWHPDLKPLMPKLKLIFFYVTTAFFISQYVKCVVYFNQESLMLILQYAPFHMGLIKSCIFQKNYKSWENMVQFISSVERRQIGEKDDTQDRILKEYIKQSRRVTYFFFTMAFFSNFFIFSEPYQKNQVTENGTLYMNIFEGYTPFRNESPGYYFSMFIQTVFGYTMSFYVITWDMMTVTMMIFFVGQLRMCGMYCSRAIDRQCTENSKRNIAKCHEFYTQLAMHQKQFNALISPVMFFYLVIISVNLGVCIIQIAELEDDLATLVSSCIYIQACLVQLLLYYWYGNEVIIESERVSFSTFESDWVEVDWRLQREVALLALTTRKRLYFSAGPFNEMSLSTFIAILRRSYSFYALLKETK